MLGRQRQSHQDIKECHETASVEFQDCFYSWYNFEEIVLFIMNTDQNKMFEIASNEQKQNPMIKRGSG